MLISAIDHQPTSQKHCNKHYKVINYLQNSIFHWVLGLSGPRSSYPTLDTQSPKNFQLAEPPPA